MKNIFTVLLLCALCASFQGHASSSYVGGALGTQQATLNECESRLPIRSALPQCKMAADYSGLLLGFGGSVELTRAVRLRVEYVLRENIDALQLKGTSINSEFAQMQGAEKISPRAYVDM